jgi:hypothetical protein
VAATGGALMSPLYLRILALYDRLPMSAIVPKPVAAVVKGCSEKTISRHYETVPISDGRVGVRKAHLEADRTPGAV